MFSPPTVIVNQFPTAENETGGPLVVTAEIDHAPDASLESCDATPDIEVNPTPLDANAAAPALLNVWIATLAIVLGGIETGGLGIGVAIATSQFMVVDVSI